jgi:enamine deaminase RidA (YjgF/YER057c/UK114 family)
MRAAICCCAAALSDIGLPYRYCCCGHRFSLRPSAQLRFEPQCKGGIMEREYLPPPPGIFHHPNFTRVVTVSGPMKLVLIAGQTAGDEASNRCIAPGDMRAQYIRVMENLDKQLRAAKASWDDVIYRRTFVLDMDAYVAVLRDPRTPKFGNPSKPSPGTLVGVTRLTDPEFLIEIDLLAAIPV